MGGPAIYELSKHFGQFEEVQRSPNHVSDSIRLYPIIHQYLVLLQKFRSGMLWKAPSMSIHIHHLTACFTPQLFSIFEATSIRDLAAST